MAWLVVLLTTATPCCSPVPNPNANPKPPPKPNPPPAPSHPAPRPRPRSHSCDFDEISELLGQALRDDLAETGQKDATLLIHDWGSFYGAML